MGLRRVGWQLARATWVACVGLGAPLAALASLPSELAQPRVAYAMHSARINQMRATPDLQRLVTVGQDKTLRVWRLTDLQALRTIHVPSDAGEEGALRAVAITPDGRQALVGGWTGVTWSGQGQLYRIDLATGRLLQTVRGLPSIIESLAVSPDGQRLAVGLGGSAGLRVLDVRTGAVLSADTAYAGAVNFVDFAPDGTLATTSGDGCLRLYGPDGQINFRAAHPPPAATDARACPGAAMGGVRFSPDGRQLAFGFQDRNELLVMDVAQRSLLRVLKVEDPAQRSLCCPNWAADGQQLYMHGAHAGSGPTPMHRLTLADGVQQRMDVGQQRFTNVLPLPGGDLLFSTTTPSLARVSPQGRLLAQALPPNGDFRFDWRSFRLSADGRQLALPMRADGSETRHFDLMATPDRAFRAATSAAADAGLRPPLRDAALAVSAVLDEFGYRHPVQVGGQPVRLKPFQSVRSWATAPAKDAVAMGTQWSVLVTDARGRVLWEQDLPAPAYQVSITPNGRWVVAAVGDGTLRWYDREGRERLGLFLHTGGVDWVAWRHDGYYTSSPGGDVYIGWLVNRGDEATPDFHRAVHFERRLYRPDLVQAALSETTRRNVDTTDLAGTLRALAAPRVTIESLAPAPQPGWLDLRLSVQATGRAVREIGVYVDGLPVLTTAQRQVSAEAGLVRELRIPVAGGPAQVRVEAETDESIGTDESLPVQPPPATQTRRGRLWVVAAGVHRFDHVPDMTPLPFATNDARELAAALAGQAGRAFTEVRTVVISEAASAKPTKANIVDQLQALQQVQPEDTTLVFLASHGTTDAAEYYFMTKDSRLDDAVRVHEAQQARARLAPGAAPSLLTGTELTGALRRLPGRRILILDTCESSAADGRSNPHTLLKRSASAQLAVMSAASGVESSYDSVESEHGVFTHALLGVLRTARQPVSLRELFDRALPAVDAGIHKIRLLEKDPVARDAIRQTPMLSSLPALDATLLHQP